MDDGSKLTSLIIGWLKTNGIFCWRNNTTGVFDPSIGKAGGFRSFNGVGALRGVPDILGILPDGTFLGIEVKAGNDKVSPQQQKFVDQALFFHAQCFVARSLDDVKLRLSNYPDLVCLKKGVNVQ